MQSTGSRRCNYPLFEEFASLSLLKHQDHYFKSAMWEYSMLVSLSAYWEWRVKLLAERFDVSTGRKNFQPVGEVLAFRYRNMELIVDDLNSRTHGKLNLKLHELRSIRNCLLHGSFNQLKEEMNLIRPDMTQNHRGNVFVLKISDGSMTNLSDVQTEEELRVQDIYGWMLEACSSGLFSTIRQEFDKSLKGIFLIIDFKAHSFDERQILFDKVIKLGEVLNEQEKENYYDYAKKMGNPNLFSGSYFDDLYSYIN